MSAINKIGPDHYRYESDLSPHGVTVIIKRYVVVGETPRCWYVVHAGLECCARDWANPSEHAKKLRKRVLKESSGRRYCYPDKAMALHSFKERQRRRLAHARRNTAVAELALSVVIPALKDIATLPPLNEYKAGHNEYTEQLSWADY